jgi:hypothetical protein
MLQKEDGGKALDSSGSGCRSVVGSFEHDDNEFLGSTKCWEFEWLSSCWLLKKDLAAWN